LDNSLLKRPLTLADIEHMLPGHWGTTPGQNFIYAHPNRVINKYDLDMIYPGIAFLSGGQSSERASARLNAMNLRFKSRAPWALAFSCARAIQQPAMEIRRGDEANVTADQAALRHRARCNRAARQGNYVNSTEMEPA